MSRCYLNGKYCVRCGREGPTPYLRDNAAVFDRCSKIMDIGCGNGRNTRFMQSRGFDVIPVDMVADFGKKVVLGTDPLPAADKSVDGILANYILMFLSSSELKQVMKEIHRIAAPGCIMMAEFYAAKDSEAPTKSESIALQKRVFDHLGWKKIKYSQERFIAVLPE